MRRFLWLPAFALVPALLVGIGFWTTRGEARMATPAAGAETTLTLVEHADRVTHVDVGPPGASEGDMQVWGPDPLYDEADSTDTGATTQGACIAFDAAGDCIVSETILFPDGSTLELQGIERQGAPSLRTIVGGSGRYLGATGTMAVTPSADARRWTKLITFGP